jgi:hypothetical protein
VAAASRLGRRAVQYAPDAPKVRKRCHAASLVWSVPEGEPPIHSGVSSRSAKSASLRPTTKASNNSAGRAPVCRSPSSGAGPRAQGRVLGTLTRFVLDTNDALVCGHSVASSSAVLLQVRACAIARGSRCPATRDMPCSGRNRSRTAGTITRSMNREDRLAFSSVRSRVLTGRLRASSLPARARSRASSFAGLAVEQLYERLPRNPGLSPFSNRTRGIEPVACASTP